MRPLLVQTGALLLLAVIGSYGQLLAVVGKVGVLVLMGVLDDGFAVVGSYRWSLVMLTCLFIDRCVRVGVVGSYGQLLAVIGNVRVLVLTGAFVLVLLALGWRACLDSCAGDGFDATGGYGRLLTVVGGCWRLLQYSCACVGRCVGDGFAVTGGNWR